MTPHELAIAHTRAWVNRVVIGLNLCPFAKPVEKKEQIRYVVTDAESRESLLKVLLAEVRLLVEADPAEIETTLLIHPAALADFLEYNDFLTAAEAILAAVAGAGVLQLASFHPQYQFADTEPGDISNATNQSPYPMLHLLRETSVSRALATYPNPETIFETNIHTLNSLGTEGWRALQAQCRRDVTDAKPQE